jgi:hypothetical protein
MAITREIESIKTIFLENTLEYHDTLENIELNKQKDSMFSELYLKHKYRYNYIFKYSSKNSSLNTQIEKLIEFYKKNYELSKENLLLQIEYYNLINDIDNNHLLNEKIKNLMKDINTKIKKVFFKFYVNIMEIETINDDNKHLYISNNTVWCDISFSILLNIFQKNLFTYLINILKGTTIHNYMFNFLAFLVESYEIKTDDLTFQRKITIDEKKIDGLTEIFYTYFRLKTIDIVYYVYLLNKKYYEITKIMVEKFIIYNINNYKNNSLIVIINNLLKIKNQMSGEKPVQEKPVQEKQKRNMVGRAYHKITKRLKELYTKKKGGESKQEIIKTKERVIVHYENVKYKRNVLIKNNKRYVRINKKLILIS